MVAGMTPTTVKADINAAILRAGYHVELAGGGHYSANALRGKVAEIQAQIPPGVGLTLNSLYINPRQFNFHRHVAFKPGSVDGIRQVVIIAAAHPEFPIILKWTGGRAGGHHSYEDFHQPILLTYASIRQQANISLVAGSGFGGADDC